MAFPLLRTVPNTSAAIAASSIPATFDFSSSYSSSSSSPSPSSNSFRFAKTHLFSFTNPTRAPRHFHLVQSFTQSPSALHMEAPSSPADLTEFMVDMKCEGCVNSVKNKLQTVDGVKNIEADLTNQSRVADFLISAAVAEFKGPDIFGVVRFAQLNMELARIEANFSGLSPGTHGWSINEFGDLTRGAASTGNVFNPEAEGTMEKAFQYSLFIADLIPILLFGLIQFLCCHIGHVTHLLVMFEAKVVPLSMRPNKAHCVFPFKMSFALGTLEADKKGDAFFSGVKKNLRVTDLIGRSVVLYQTGDKSEAGIEAAVIARSAGVGENYKKLCTCDGTIIWESSSNDFFTAKSERLFSVVQFSSFSFYTTIATLSRPKLLQLFHGGPPLHFMQYD
ncbi:hypothetical protein CDL15_Pgr017825 [Punica granatum]|uniref:Superoxide dismutase copper chaperone n=1 Tax=Punica granatum TaxID=22663 RepID=A0A218WIS9_PUNGR|nr:hypothetical protein CDL15_Pgr017825 [Punica granatum]